MNSKRYKHKPVDLFPSFNTMTLLSVYKSKSHFSKDRFGSWCFLVLLTLWNVFMLSICHPRAHTAPFYHSTSAVAGQNRTQLQNKNTHCGSDTTHKWACDWQFDSPDDQRVFTELCLCFHVIQFQEIAGCSLCQPPQGVSLQYCVCMQVCACAHPCGCVCVWYRKSRLWSSHFPAAPHVWIEARCFEMLKSQPVHCLAVTHNSPTYSLLRLLFLPPSPLPPPPFLASLF